MRELFTRGLLTSELFTRELFTKELFTTHHFTRENHTKELFCVCFRYWNWSFLLCYLTWAGAVLGWWWLCVKYKGSEWKGVVWGFSLNCFINIKTGYQHPLNAKYIKQLICRWELSRYSLLCRMQDLITLENIRNLTYTLNQI